MGMKISIVVVVVMGIGAAALYGTLKDVSQDIGGLGG